MTLFRATADGSVLLDMGQIGALDNLQASTLCSNLTDDQARNRRILLSAACQAGLVNYGYEWWHYSYGDRVWAFAKEKPVAMYGAVSERSSVGCGPCSLS
eukprot:3344182-Rhodomonas_salina.2